MTMDSKTKISFGSFVILLVILLLAVFNESPALFQKNSNDTSYMTNEEIRHWFDFQDYLNNEPPYSKYSYEEYWKEYDNFKATVPLIDKHINKILSENKFFKKISPKPEIYIKRQRMSSKLIESAYDEPNSSESGASSPSDYDYRKNRLLKETPKSDVVIEVDAVTKNEGDGTCFTREGYTFFVDLIAKTVIYIAEYSERGCE